MPYLDNLKSPCESITAPSPGVAAGAFVLIGGVLFYCPEAIATGAVGAGYWRDILVRDAAKLTGTAWTKGDALYWDNTNFRFTKISTGNTLRGYAASDAVSGAAVGDVGLIGNVV